MPKAGVDIFVVDASLSPSATKAARRRAACGQSRCVCGGSPAHRPPGVEGIIPRPAVVDEARRLADLCVRAKLPNLPCSRCTPGGSGSFRGLQHAEFNGIETLKEIRR
jgi:hypothetical protein